MRWKILFTLLVFERTKWPLLHEAVQVNMETFHIRLVWNYVPWFKKHASCLPYSITDNLCTPLWNLVLVVNLSAVEALGTEVFMDPNWDVYQIWSQEHCPFPAETRSYLQTKVSTAWRWVRPGLSSELVYIDSLLQVRSQGRNLKTRVSAVSDQSPTFFYSRLNKARQIWSILVIHY